MIPLPVREGYIPFREYHNFYRVVGDLDRIPLGKAPVLALHGRPPSHEVLEPLEKLFETGRPIVFYDQLGCGRSDRPDNPAMWTIDLFVEEVAAVRRHLHLEQVHLLGHSWGGVVVMEYALRSPRGLVSLILASTYCDRSLLDADWDRLRAGLPKDVLETLLRHEAAGTTEDPAYEQANRFFDLRHICRIDPWPECFERAMEHPPVGRVNTEGWTVRDRLDEIKIPTLVTCGHYDFCTPAQAEIIHKGIQGSEFVIFEESSHYPHIEETDRFLSVLDKFMTQRENDSGSLN